MPSEKNSRNMQNSYRTKLCKNLPGATLDEKSQWNDINLLRTRPKREWNSRRNQSKGFSTNSFPTSLTEKTRNFSQKKTR